MGFFNKIISFFKKKDSPEVEDKEESISDLVAPSQSPNVDVPSIIPGSEPSQVNSNSDHYDSEEKVEVSGTRQENARESSSEEVGSNVQNTTEELSYIDAIRAAEEERRKREWLEFLRTKRAKRKKELEEELTILDKQLEYVQQRILAIKDERKSIRKSDLPEFAVPQDSLNKISIHEFSTPSLQNITSMREYQSQRIEEERRIKEEAENAVLNSIAAVRRALSKRDLHEAEGGLNLISQQIAFVENQDIRDRVKDIVLSITELRNRLDEERRAKEEEKRKKEALEAKLRAEAQERERLEREKARQREEAERIERDRKYQEELKAKAEAQRKEMLRLESLSSTLKDDADDIEDFFNDNGVQYFYHFTEASNIPLIKQRKGLFSWSYLESHGMKIPCAGGNELSRGLDRDKGLEDFVRLSLCKSHPMAYRLYKQSNGQSKFVLLKIKIDVAFFESTLFSDINATDNNAKIGDNLSFIEKGFDFNAIRLDWCYGDTPEHKKRQAEVMVKTFLPAKYIVNLDNPEELTFKN